MAYAAYRYYSQPLPAPGLAPAPRTATVFVVMTVTVAMGQAWHVRAAVARMPGVGVLRCRPRLHDGRVHLDLRLPLHRADAVMDGIVGCVDDGEIGPFVSWQSHLAAVARRAGRPAQVRPPNRGASARRGGQNTL